MKTVALFFLLHFTNGERAESMENNGPSPNVQYVYPNPAFYMNYVNPSSGLKEPIDFLEMAMVYPQTEEEKRYYLKTAPLSDIQFMRRPTDLPDLIYPGDRIMENKTYVDFFKFEDLQSRNLEIDKPKVPKKEPHRSEAPVNLGFLSKYDKKSLNPVNLTLNDKTARNFAFEHTNVKIAWTTCEEFKKNSVFHPKDLLDIDWIPFYMWTAHDERIAVVHKFRVPTVKAVQAYKKDYGPYLSEKVDWNQPKLMLEEVTPMLLIAVDQTGLFHGIKHQMTSDYLKTHPKAKYPVITLRMKILDPYLALMYCGDFYAQILAINGQVPETDELKTEEAKVLNFNGTGSPVSLVSAREENIRKIAEWKLLEKQREEESKFVNDYEAPRDKFLDRW